MTDQRIDFGVEFEHRGPKLKYDSATVEQIIADGDLYAGRPVIEHIERPGRAYYYLKMACLDALKELTPEIESTSELLRYFGKKYHGYPPTRSLGKNV
jgi:hypothetical protein